MRATRGAAGRRAAVRSASSSRSYGWRRRRRRRLLSRPPPAAAVRAADPSLQPHRLAEALLHDLVGAAADRAQARVARHALDLVLAHVAGAAVELQAGVDDVECGALGGELGHGHLAGGVLTVREAPERVV